MENMPSGGVWRTVWRICLLGGYGERYGEYAFWGGMENSMENMPSGGGMENSMENMPSGGGMENSMENMPSRGGMENSMENSLLRGGVKGLNCKRNFLLEGK